jgi:hypothetical protein
MLLMRFMTFFSSPNVETICTYDLDEYADE